MTILLCYHPGLPTKISSPFGPDVFKGICIYQLFCQIGKRTFCIDRWLCRGTGYVIKRFTSDYNYSPSRSRFISTWVQWLPVYLLHLWFTVWHAMRIDIRFVSWKYPLRICRLPYKAWELYRYPTSTVEVFTAKSPVKKHRINQWSQTGLLLFTGDLVNYKQRKSYPISIFFLNWKGSMEVIQYSAIMTMVITQWPSKRGKKLRIWKY